MSAFFKSMMIFSKKQAKGLTALFFALIVAVGLFTVPQYGHAWDDASEMNILRMALKEYAALIPVQTRWQQELEEMPLVRISESDERDHGICAYYPLFWAFARSDLPYQTLQLIWRCHTWLIFSAGLFALYACARHMGMSRILCCVGALLLLLTPPFFAAGHYNNKDIPLMTFALMVLWQTARLMKKPSLSSAIGFALAAGFCASTRIIGVALAGLCGLMVVLHLVAAKRFDRRIIGLGVFTLGLMFVIYALLTPALLAGPLAFFSYTLQNAVGFSRWSGTTMLWGRIYFGAVSKPHFLYLPLMILASTPLWMLALLAAGSIALLVKVCRDRFGLLSSRTDTVSVTCMLCWVLPLLAAVVLHMMAYNGWRHLYFVYGPMVLCMLYGIKAIADLLGRKSSLQRAGALVLAGCLFSAAVGIAINHPYQYAYYNATVPKENRARLFDLDYWNISCLDAMHELLDRTEGSISLAASDIRTCSGMEMAFNHHMSDERLTVIPFTDTVTQPDYVIANLSYAASDGWQPDKNLVPFVTISSYGSPVTIIYQVADTAP